MGERARREESEGTRPTATRALSEGREAPQAAFPSCCLAMQTQRFENAAAGHVCGGGGAPRDSAGSGATYRRACNLRVLIVYLFLSPLYCPLCSKVISLLFKMLSRLVIAFLPRSEGALPPPCIVRKDPRVPHTARRGA